MKIVALTLITLMIAFTTPAQTVVKVTFEKLSAPVELKKTGYFKGPRHPQVVPDYIGWNPGQCVATQKIDQQGEFYYRLNITKAGAQFFVPLEEFKAKRMYKIVITARASFAREQGFYLRQIRAPYRALTPNFNFPISDNFLTREYPVILKSLDQDSPTGLFITFQHLGTLDLKKIQLEEITQQEFDALTLNKLSVARRKAPQTKNFLTHSTLPHGLQTGWTQFTKKQAEGGSVKTDDSLIGPSGQPALTLTSNNGLPVGICSEPFLPADPTKPITVSFAYRGKGEFKATISSNNHTFIARDLKPLTHQWQRAALTVKLPLDRISATLQVFGTGNLAVDAFRVAASGQTDYVPQAPHEISFTLPETETSPARIQFADEPALVKVFVTPAPKDKVTVKLSVTDLYGKTTQLPELTQSQGTVDFGKGQVTYGQFRLEAQAFIGGQAVSPVTETVITRLPKPVFWHRDAPHSPFGIHANQLPAAITALKAGGFNWNRLHDGGHHLSCWFFLEPKKGTWAFRDREINLYRKNNIMLYGQLGGAPAWATSLQDTPAHPAASYGSMYFTPKPDFEKDYQNYCETMTRKYKGIIDDWFIWNEPWGTFFFHHGYDPKTKTYLTWSSKEKTATYYAHLSKLTFQAAKKGNPDCHISGFNAHATPDWSRVLYRQGAYPACDEMDYHSYFQQAAGFPQDGIADSIRQAFAGVLEHHKLLGKPIIMSEGQAGSPSIETAIPRVGLYKHAICWNNLENYHQIADENVRYMLSLLANQVKRVFFYTAHAYLDLGTGNKLQVMLGADGYPHPSLCAMSALALRVENRPFQTVKELTDGLFAYLFSDGKETTAVLSTSRSIKATVTCDSALKPAYADLYGNPQPRGITLRNHVAYITASATPEQLLKALAVKLIQED